MEAPGPMQQLLQKPPVGDRLWELALYTRGSAGKRCKDLRGKEENSRHVKIVAC